MTMTTFAMQSIMLMLTLVVVVVVAIDQLFASNDEQFEAFQLSMASMALQLTLHIVKLILIDRLICDVSITIESKSTTSWR